MGKGKNLISFTKKEQCLTLVSELHQDCNIPNYKIFRLLPNNEIEYLHPNNGISPEKAILGRTSTGQQIGGIQT